jgi:hypothetical protein
LQGDVPLKQMLASHMSMPPSQKESKQAHVNTVVSKCFLFLVRFAMPVPPFILCKENLKAKETKQFQCTMKNIYVHIQYIACRSTQTFCQQIHLRPLTDAWKNNLRTKLFDNKKIKRQIVKFYNR